MPWLSRLATAMFVVALPLLLITTNVRFLAGEVRLYERGFREHDSARRTGLPLSELDRAAREVIAYFENDAATLRVIVTDNGEEVSLFNARETTHMEDVKALMNTVFRVQEVTLAFVVAYIAGVFLWAGAGSLRRLAVESLAGIGVGVVIVGVVGALALTGFDETWNRFHRLVFTNDLWQLNPATDKLIQMFPEPFWEEMTYFLALMTIGEGLIIVVAALAAIFFTRASRRPTEPKAVRVRATRTNIIPGD